MIDLSTIVAPLFVPANRPDRFGKAAASGADAIILDLEDAVPENEKVAARDALAIDFTDLPVLVRINAAGTEWHEADIAAVASLGCAGVIVPKSEQVTALASVAAAGRIVALIETARGLANAREISACRDVVRLAFGSVDYAADLGIDHVREALAFARAELVLASRLADIPAPLDGVTVEIADMTVAVDDARYARTVGFGGKLLIHPRQVTPVWQAFMPDEGEISWASKVLSTPDGAVVVDGSMVDEPVRIRARSIMRRAKLG